MPPPLPSFVRTRGTQNSLPSSLSLGGSNPTLTANDNRTNLQRTFMILTALPLTLALIAFLLSLSEDIHKHLIEEDVRFPGWQSKLSRPSIHYSSKEASKSAVKFPHEPGFRSSLRPLKEPKIAIMTTTASGLDQVLPWILYHKVIGVSSFYLFVEGRAASINSTSVLNSISGVNLIYRTKKLEALQSKSRIWNESWLSAFFYRPCNYELFVRQALNMEHAITLATESNLDWISHVDTDELLYPAGSPDFSLQSLLMQVDGDIDNVIFPNYESIVERDDVEDRFLEVSLFKKNYNHMSKETYFSNYREVNLFKKTISRVQWKMLANVYKEASKGNPNYFMTYGNGKSAARIQPGLRGNGAHRFQNYFKKPKEHTFQEAAILHYTYTKFSDLTSRRNRCNCKPNKEDVKKCFILDFDRQAYIVAATQNEEQMKAWYIEHVVWGNPEVNQNYIQKGIFGRIYTPQVIIRGLLSSGVMDAAISQGLISRAYLSKNITKKLKAIDKDEYEEEEKKEEETIEKEKEEENKGKEKEEENKEDMEKEEENKEEKEETDLGKGEGEADKEEKKEGSGEKVEREEKEKKEGIKGRKQIDDIISQGNDSTLSKKKNTKVGSASNGDGDGVGKGGGEEHEEKSKMGDDGSKSKLNSELNSKLRKELETKTRNLRKLGSETAKLGLADAKLGKEGKGSTTNKEVEARVNRRRLMEAAMPPLPSP